MPTTLEQLETKFNLRFKTSFKWGTNFDEKDTGIYIISTSIDKSYLPKSFCLWSVLSPTICIIHLLPMVEVLANHFHYT